MNKPVLHSSESSRPLWHLGVCRICREGTIGVRVCGRCGDLALLCDECDAAWESVTTSSAPRYARQGDVCCLSCSASLWQPPAHWASRQEIAATGWLAAAIASGKATLVESIPKTS